jgi:iron complex transport system ATP-binding protein
LGGRREDAEGDAMDPTGSAGAADSAPRPQQRSARPPVRTRLALEIASLAVDHVSFAYPSAGRAKRSWPAIEDVSLSVTQGSLTGLLGPNGCGKTTLLKLLSGVVRAQRGAVTLAGRPLNKVPRRELARHMAVVPQETQPAFEYSVTEMALMGRHPHLGRFELEGPDDLDAVQVALATTGVSHLANRLFSTLSGGEKQRVVIASALVQAGDVLLLDEPTASLDLAYQLEVASLLARLNREQGVTMVLATHDLNLAASICDTLVLLLDGRVLAQGWTSEVLNAPMVRELYGIDADVRFHEGAGHLTVVPVGRAQ